MSAKRVLLGALALSLGLAVGLAARAGDAQPICPRSGEPVDPAGCVNCPHYDTCPAMATRAGQAAPAAPRAAEAPAVDAQAEARLRAETADEIRKNIRQLGTPNWRPASARLIRIGRPAVPFLIGALSGGVDPSYPAAAYAVQEPGRASRPRPLNDVAYEILCNLFQNHTNYQGALPGQDRQAWEQFWARNEANIQFGQP